MSKVFVFPGQGSQQSGMGQDLFAQFPDLISQTNEQTQYTSRQYM